MATKKDYERAAKIAQAYADPEQWRAVVGAYVALFSGENPRFDERRFRNACQLPNVRYIKDGETPLED